MHIQSLNGSLTHIFEDEENQILAKSILGSTDVDKIAEDINQLCACELGSPIAHCLNVEFSVGASFGLALQDGRKIFLKIHKTNEDDRPAAITLASLTIISKIQRDLAASGFPCPSVIHEPIQTRYGVATVDAFENIGEQKDAHNSIIRGEIARTLADLIQRTQAYRSMPGLPCGRLFSSSTLYPVPHNVLFDFDGTAKGAAWIDEIARKAKMSIQDTKGEMVLGHTDWSLKHFRFKDSKIVMIYDWDSLKLEDELNLLGIAAATFTTTWDIKTKITPSVEECYAFVKDYEFYRGRPFTKQAFEKISAAITYCMAYISRCEFALDADGEKFEGSFRQALQEMNRRNVSIF
ncbi:hypothetical protein [Alicyclobacillus fodiniaquatilis]|uniref:Aminoglycoside phosphotransferase domain-containing protein n=1 Tax=Alicyclobacillus fodiniaquatilis TaxID=1661150 RepID=A0ABW4JHJ0_9BACL